MKAISDPNAATAIASAPFAADRDQLCVLTCGSVDDGKSTLIGRLLLDASLVFEDHVAALTRDSRTHGTVAGDIDPALLVDGLEAEREQGITIDVAYRYFGTPRRRFIVADTPGHKDYTRNMVTGASTSYLAILLVDAGKGLLEQTRRHAFLCALLGIRQFVLAVNKMDLVGYEERRFNDIAEAFAQFADRFPGCHIVAIPTSALHGDNIVRRSVRMPWYRGLPLLEYLENVAVDGASGTAALRLPVQYVNRPNAGFRGYAGTIASGTLHQGMEVVIPRTGVRSRIAHIVTMDGELREAGAAVPVTVVLDNAVDVLSLIHI